MRSMPRTWTAEDREKLREHAQTVQLWKAAAGKRTGATSEDGKRRAAQRGRKTGLRGVEGITMRRWLASLNSLCKALAAR